MRFKCTNLDAMRIFRILLLVYPTLVFAEAPMADTPEYTHNSYINGKRFAFVISKDKYAAMRSWNPSLTPNPPVSAQRALVLAQTRLSSIPIPEGFGWSLEQISLVPVGIDSQEAKWMYSVRFRYILKDKPMTGVWPTMDLIVTMDGELIEPKVDTYEPKW
jgi:hypothetical protein